MTRTNARAEVAYRATASWGEAEVRLRLDPAKATVADAWARLSARYADLDPRTLEIEIRLAPTRPAFRGLAPQVAPARSAAQSSRRAGAIA